MITDKKRISFCISNQGFTLVELIVAIAIFGLVITSIYSAFNTQHNTYQAQKQITAIQQNIRATMYVIEREIRMAGYDPDLTGNFGITAVGNNSLTLTFDDDAGGTTTITYSMAGTTLNRSGGPLADNIQAFALAYAYDRNQDGNLDTSGNGHVIWAIDTDNDNLLDLRLDTDDDGDIDAADDTNTDNVINGVALPSTVSMEDIRAVRIWVLGRAERADMNYAGDNETYIVGRAVINANDRIRRRFSSASVKCRNMGT